MTKIELPLGQIRDLILEIKGTGTSKGLLNQDLKASTKFRLHQLVKKLQEELTGADEQRLALIRKYGTEKTSPTGELYREVVKNVKDKKGKDTEELTEDYLLFLGEYTELMSTPIEIQFHKIKESELEFKTDEMYSSVFEYLVDLE
jgi:hypothetical protein